MPGSLAFNRKKKIKFRENSGFCQTSSIMKRKSKSKKNYNYKAHNIKKKKNWK